MAKDKAKTTTQITTKMVKAKVKAKDKDKIKILETKNQEMVQKKEDTTQTMAPQLNSTKERNKMILTNSVEEPDILWWL